MFDEKNDRMSLRILKTELQESKILGTFAKSGDEAKVRTKAGNKGYDCAMGAIEMVKYCTIVVSTLQLGSVTVSSTTVNIDKT